MPSSNRERILQAAALLIIVLVGVYFRFTGLTWGGYEYPHPDERFLIWVVADIAPVDDPGDYFDTQRSTLNPANRGHGFYVYGDFPVIATRYIAEWTSDPVGWEQILQVGRGLSAGLDLLTVLLVYLIAQRLTNWKWATLAGLFSAAAVLQIQQSHFFTVDSFATTFTTLAVYLAVVLATEVDGLTNRTVALLSVLFGAAVGLGMACKLNTFPVALLLPAAFAVRWLRLPRGDSELEDDARGELLELNRWKGLLTLAGLAAAGGLAAFLVFRLAQPYAFSGPSFFNISIDEGWLKSINDLRSQSAGDVDFPPALQWARRSHLFSLKNMVLWGLGLPLGLLAWAGFLLFTWSAARAVLMKKWSALLESRHSGALLVWGWTAFYFTWQSLAWNPTMRYQLPIYPTLAVLAAWGLARAWRWTAQGGGNGSVRASRQDPAYAVAGNGGEKSRGWWKAGVGVLGGLVLILTLAWAFAFTRIYTRTESRLAASQWIFENVPGPLNLTIAGTPEGTVTQLVPLSEQATVRAGQPYITVFDSQQPAALDAVLLPSTQVSAGTGLTLRARVVQASQPENLAAQGTITIPDGTFERYELPLTSLAPLQPGERYALILEIPTADETKAENISEMGFSALQLSGQLQLRLYARAQQAVLKASTFQMGSFQLKQAGTLRQVRLPEGNASPSALAVITNNPQTGEQQSSLARRGEKAQYLLENPLSYSAGALTLAAVTSQDPSQPLDPTQELHLDFLDEPSRLILPALTGLARADNPLWMQFSVKTSGMLSQVTLGYAAQVDPGAGTVPVMVEISSQSVTGSPVFKTQLAVAPAAESDPRGKAYTLSINPPVEVQQGQTYTLTLTPLGQGAVTVRGSAPANESGWDMGLPFRTGGYDPYGGIYRGDLNFEMYWEDNADKYQRFTGILDNADWIFMSSNRQWGTTTRVPERHPLTTEFYRALLGCPADKEVIWCYNVAEPGMFAGELGFELVKTFTSYPNLGPLEINTQFAEEAFTVYDHAKVMIFRKTASYDSIRARAVLGKVDLNLVARFTPKKAADYKNMLLPAVTWAVQQAGGTWATLFPPGGLQNRTPWLGLVLWYVFLWLLGVVVYPLLRLALRSLDDRAYPLARIAGLLLFAYPAWLAGSLGVPVTRVTLAVIFAALAAVGAVLAILQRGSLREEWRARRGYFLRVELIALALFTISLLIRLGNPDLWHPIYGGEKPMDFSHFNAVLKSTLFPAFDPWFAGGSLNYYYFGYVLVGMPVKLLGITPSVAYNLILPALFSIVGLAAFSIGWNLMEGRKGEEEMSNEFMSEEEMSEEDISDELMSDEFTGEELMGRNIPHFNSSTHNPSTHPSYTHPPSTHHPYSAGLFAILALLILGNLGTLRMLWEGPQKLMVSDEEMRAGTLFQRIEWTAQGIGKLTSGEAAGLPYSPADWYWKPSRAIQPEAGNEITEFPFFTFIYADLHAHLMALPLTLLGIAWALAALFSGGRPRGIDPSQEQNRLGTGLGWLSYGLLLLLGALVYGALRPTNTWDQYTYLALGCIALAVGQWKALIPSPALIPNPSPGGGREQYTNLGASREGGALIPGPSPVGGREEEGGREKEGGFGRWLWVLLPPLVLGGLAVLLYRPFDWYFGQGYSELVVYEGAKTHIGSYLVHWGLFFFVIAAWLFSELVDWMAATPLSHVNRLRPYKRLVTAVLLAMIVLLAFLVYRGVAVVWIAGPLGLLAVLLLLRPGQPLAKRAVLFMIGTALVLTLAVELVAVKGDINRMNTVFKFYYQAWSLLSLSAAAALGWLLRRNARAGAAWSLWLVGLGVLVCCAALYPVTAARGKIVDRMTPEAPRTLDGMDYMAFTRYGDGPSNETYREMDLNQDYYAIRWVQENIEGTPVIVEAHTPEYRHWGTRFTIYTGLPAVVGWNWHERQQRALTPDTWVYERVNAVPAFYNATSAEEARAFLEKYNVGLIVVGQLERIYYSPSGLAKFEELNGVLWDKVYEEGDTVLYQVR